MRPGALVRLFSFHAESITTGLYICLDRNNPGRSIVMFDNSIYSIPTQQIRIVNES